MKLVVISHTEHYKNKSGKIVGWGSTIKELNYLSRELDELVHVAPFYKEPAPSSSLEYDGINIEYIPLEPSGGKGLQKISILSKAPKNLSIIYKAIKNADYVQFRAPTGMGVYVLPFLKFFNRKRYWVKYAGNWVDPNMPLGNKLQKKWLQKFIPNQTKVTVNGFWKNEKSNILSFENPCLNKEDRNIGKEFIRNKKLDSKLNFCFVGALNEHKGVLKILEAFSSTKSDRVGEIHFVGDSHLKEQYIEESKSIDHSIIFHGFLPKDKIKDIYNLCHFILLPSKSEGFPKVIGEAMNFSCVPIVSDVSCISDYVEDNKNGYLISSIDISGIKEKIEQALNISEVDYLEMINHNYILAEKFTYDNYITRLKEEIFING